MTHTLKLKRSIFQEKSEKITFLNGFQDGFIQDGFCFSQVHLVYILGSTVSAVCWIWFDT